MVVEVAYARRVERGGRGGVAVGRVVIRVSFGKDDLVERERGDLRGLVAALQERLEPQVALLLHVVGTERGMQHDIRHQVERGGERALGDVELDGERFRTGAGVELRAEEGEFALQRVRVAGARALGEHAGGESREARLSRLEPRSTVDDQRDVNERQRVVFDHLQGDAVRHRAACDGGKVEFRAGAESGRLGAIEGAGGVLRNGRERGARSDRSEEGELFADHWATPFLAASSGLPMGTTEIMTRLAWRYFLSTRCTSAAVTAR